MEVNPVYTLTFSQQALKDIQYFKKLGNAALLKKIDKLLAELECHPATGTGQVEALRFDLTGYWSRRINSEHRILYDIQEDKKVVAIYKLRGHY